MKEEAAVGGRGYGKEVVGKDWVRGAGSPRRLGDREWCMGGSLGEGREGRFVA